MAFIPAPLCSLVELVFLLAQQRIENTLWIRHDAVPNAALLANIGEGVIGWWIANMAPLVSQDCVLDLVQVTYKGDPTGPQAIVTTGLPDAGNVPSGAVPNGSAFVVKFGTDLLGRSFRGRNYVAGLPATSVAGSIYSAPTTNAVLTAYSALAGVLTPLNAEHVVVSFQNNGVPRVSGVATSVSSYTNTNRGTRSQRRRNPGIGS